METPFLSSPWYRMRQWLFGATVLLAFLLLPSLKAGAQSTAPVVTILHSFGDGSVPNDGSGALYQGLILGIDGNLWGTAFSCVYKMTLSGQVTVVHVFAGGANDGRGAVGNLVQGSDGNFYGVTGGGGTFDNGVVYKITPSGQVTVLHSFADTGIVAEPLAGLVQGSDGSFYGTTWGSVTGGGGTIYKITSSGQYTLMHSFLDGSVTNDGGFPASGVIQASDGNFYGMTSAGGSTRENDVSAGDGVIYKMTPSGQITILHSFGGGSVPNDGATPYGNLIQASDGNFYGTTEVGGSAGLGTVFKMTLSGQVTILHSFSDGSVLNDGQEPDAGLIQATDGNFYGTTLSGGTNEATGSGPGLGTVFKITSSGQETILHLFGDGSVPNDGIFPRANLLQLSNGNFYGTTEAGGSTFQSLTDLGDGTIYRVNFAPAPPADLTATAGNAQVFLSWNSNALATSYNVYRSLTAGGEGFTAYQAGVTGTTLTDTGVANGTTYYYEVTAVDSEGEGPKSNEASAKPDPPITGAPMNLVAVAGNAEVSLTWTAPTGPVSNYDVYMGLSSGGEGSTPIATGIKNPADMITNLTNGTTYYFEVTAVNGGGESSRSNEASATPEPPVPPAPTGLNATGGNAETQLSWSASAGAMSYNLYRGITPGGEGATPYLSGLKTTTFIDTGLTNGTTYYYEVTAANSGGESGKSNEASATPFATLVFPAGLQMFSVPYDYSGVSLSALFGYASPMLAVWDQPTNQYNLTPNAPADQVGLGQGYWVKFPNAITITTVGVPADTTKNFDIPLVVGWNMIGEPFPATTPITSLLFDNGTKTYAQATTGNSPLVGAIVWSYSMATGKYAKATSLAPQGGYWIFAFSATDVQVPHP